MNGYCHVRGVLQFRLAHSAHRSIGKAGETTPARCYDGEGSSRLVELRPALRVGSEMKERPRKLWMTVSALAVQLTGAALFIGSANTKSDALFVAAAPLLIVGTLWMFHLYASHSFEQNFPWRRRRGS